MRSICLFFCLEHFSDEKENKTEIGDPVERKATPCSQSRPRSSPLLPPHFFSVGFAGMRATSPMQTQSSIQFPFFDLLEEMRQEVIRFCDGPTRLSLSLTCRNRHLNYSSDQRSKYSNVWTFVDDCAHLGYHSLLKYAVSCGCRVDEMALRVAVKANHTDTALWLFSVLQYNVSFPCVESITNAAATNGNYTLTTAFYENMLPPTSRKLAHAAARGGYIQLASDLLNSAKQPDLFAGIGFHSELFYSAAKGGHFQSALLFRGSEPPSQQELNLILLGGSKGGHFKAVQFAAERGAFPSPEALAGSGVVNNKDISILKYFDDRFSDQLKEYLYLITLGAVVHPYLETIQYLESKGVDFASLPFLTRSLLKEGNDPEEDRTMFGTEERFECLQYFYQKGVRWGRMAIHSLQWATLDQAKWIFARATEPPNPFEAITVYFSSVSCCNLDIVKFLMNQVDHVDEVSFVVAAFLDNNLEVLDILFTKSTSAVFTSWTLIQISYELFRKVTKKSKVKRCSESLLDKESRWHRVRFGNMLAVIRWFMQRGAPLAPSAFASFCRVPNKCFQQELRQVATQYNISTESQPANFE